MFIQNINIITCITQTLCGHNISLLNLISVPTFVLETQCLPTTLPTSD